MRINSIKFKTNILFTIILLIILTVYNTILFYSAQHILYHSVDDNLKIKAKEIVQILHAYQELDDQESSSNNLLQRFLNFQEGVVTKRMIIDDLWRSDVEALNLKQDFIQVLDLKGQVVLHSADFNESVFALFQGQAHFAKDREFLQDAKSGSYHLRVINHPFKIDEQYSGIIQIGTPLKDVDKIIKKLLLFIFASEVFILLMTSFLGGVFVRRILQPVTEVVKAASHITSKDLTVRIQQRDFDAEMKRLIEAFNMMIGRLEKSFGHISEFSSHVAHELKTPLAIIKGELELALDQNQIGPEQKDVIEDCLQEIDRMVKIIQDLLLLAKLDYNPEVFHFREFDFNEFFNEIVEQGKLLAASQDIQLEVEPLGGAQQKLVGDKIHLRRLFHNIINNAIKFTPAKGKIMIFLSEDKNFLSVKIKDTGIGISEENLPKIFEKFFRVYPEGRQFEQGSGLGLSIALSIANAHQGDIQVESHLQQGTVFTVSLPIKNSFS